MKLPIHSAYFNRKRLALLTAQHMYCTVVEMMGKDVSHIEGVTKLGLNEFETKTIISIIDGKRQLCELEGVTQETNLSGVFAALKRLGYKFKMSNSSGFSNETIWDFSIDDDKLDLLDKYRQFIEDEIPEFVFLYEGNQFRSCVTVEAKEPANV